MCGDMGHVSFSALNTSMRTLFLFVLLCLPFRADTILTEYFFGKGFRAAVRKTRRLCFPLCTKRLLKAIRRVRGSILHFYVGLTFFLGVGRQAVAADLEILIAVEEEWARRDLPFGVRNLVMASLLLGMWCMRFECMLRSILLHLSTEQLVWLLQQGEKKPSPWCMPRFTPAGRDLGKAVWSYGRQACTKAKTLLQFLLAESHSDGALTFGDLSLNIKQLMAARLDSSAMVLTISCGNLMRSTGMRLGLHRPRSSPGPWYPCLCFDGWRGCVDVGPGMCASVGGETASAAQFRPTVTRFEAAETERKGSAASARTVRDPRLCWHRSPTSQGSYQRELPRQRLPDLWDLHGSGYDWQART